MYIKRSATVSRKRATQLPQIDPYHMTWITTPCAHHHIDIDIEVSP